MCGDCLHQWALLWRRGGYANTQMAGTTGVPACRDLLYVLRFLVGIFQLVASLYMPTCFVADRPGAVVLAGHLSERAACGGVQGEMTERPAGRVGRRDGRGRARRISRCDVDRRRRRLGRRRRDAVRGRRPVRRGAAAAARAGDLSARAGARRALRPADRARLRRRAARARP